MNITALHNFSFQTQKCTCHELAFLSQCLLSVVSDVLIEHLDLISEFFDACFVRSLHKIYLSYLMDVVS